MSERLIKHWGENSAVTFGATGVKGDIGEEFVADFFRKRGYAVTMHSDRDKQISGFDLTFQKLTGGVSYGADVKNNLTTDGTFFVECKPNGWLFNPKKTSKLIIHVNPLTEWLMWYNRSRMQRYIKEMDLIGNEIVPIRRFTKGVDWIERKRAEPF